MADCVNVTDAGIAGKPWKADKPLSLNVLVTTTVTVLFELEPGEDAAADTVIPEGRSALTAADRLVQLDGKVKPALL